MDRYYNRNSTHSQIIHFPPPKSTSKYGSPALKRKANLLGSSSLAGNVTGKILNFSSTLNFPIRFHLPPPRKKKKKKKKIK